MVDSIFSGATKYLWLFGHFLPKGQLFLLRDATVQKTEAENQSSVSDRPFFFTYFASSIPLIIYQSICGKLKMSAPALLIFLMKLNMGNEGKSHIVQTTLSKPPKVHDVSKSTHDSENPSP